MKKLVLREVGEKIEYVICRDEKPWAAGSYDGRVPLPGDILLCRMREALKGGARSSGFCDLGDVRTGYVEPMLSYRPGDYFAAQVKTAGRDSKGAEMTDVLSFSGSYAAAEYVPEAGNPLTGKREPGCPEEGSTGPASAVLKISRKIREEILRDQITEYFDSFAASLAVPGYRLLLTARTSVKEDTLPFFRKEAETFKERLLCALETGSNGEKKPGRVLRKIGFADYLLRTYRVLDFDRVLSGSPALSQRIRGEFRELGLTPEFAETKGDFDPFTVDGGASLLPRYTGRKVYTRSGGAVVYDKTEALHVFDVDSGGSGLPPADLNLEAAEEIFRVIRLRNLGGMIVCDFIRMKNEEDRRKLLAFLKQQAEEDYSFTEVLGFSGLGLAEIARKRV